MKLEGKRIGWGITGSFCTLGAVLAPMEALVREGAQVVPVFSENAYNTDTRFFKAVDFIQAVRDITGCNPICSIVDAEPIGPQKLLDMMLVAPCTGNTAAKLANGITDTPVLMAAKSQLRNGGPLVIAISTNDGLVNNARNIGMLQGMKNIYFVPYEQDDAMNKPGSLVARMEKIPDACAYALEGKQVKPLLWRN